MISISKIIGKFIKNASQRDIDQLQQIVKKINTFEAKKYKKCPDENFVKKTKEFKNKIKDGQKFRWL